MTIAVVASGAALLALLLCKGETTRQETAPHTPKSGVFVVLLAAAALMTVTVSVNDGILTAMHAGGAVDLAAYPRLFYALGLLVAGLLADIKRRALLPLFTVSAMFISSVASVFLSSPSLYSANAILLYFCCGFYVIFLTVSFIDLAPSLRGGPPVAGAGRIARSLTAAAVAAPAVLLFDAYGEVGAVIISSALSIAALLLLAISGLLLPGKRSGAGNKARISAYAARHSLTPRETEIFTRVVTNDDSVERIAAELFISKQVIYRHLAAVFEKTNTKTRAGLIKDFFSENE